MVLKQLTGHWGHVSLFWFSFSLVLFYLCISLILLTMNSGFMQVGGLNSGLMDIAYHDIRTSKADKKAEGQVKEVETELFKLKKSIKEKESEFKSKWS